MSARFLARAPSNIALIKYMGKAENSSGSPELRNLPENSSLSMTLDSLCTWTELREAAGSGVRWLAEAPAGAAASARVPRLAPEAVERAAAHLRNLAALLPAALAPFGIAARDLNGSAWEIRSANSFPHSSGIASSASSFAALTLAAAAAAARDPRAFQAAYGDDARLRRALAKLSRTGSGSSCRSFEGPWVEWSGSDAAAIETRMPPMASYVLLVSKNPKSVSSSEAHVRVKTSPLWKERAERVSERAHKMRAALATGDVGKVSHLAWSEAWEMHSLFHTSSPPFSYWEPGTIDTLQWLASFLGEDRPPVVTLDAGPNIHLIVEESRVPLWNARLEERFGALFVKETVLTDRQGSGATNEQELAVF